MKYVILIVDDEREVLDTVEADLAPFRSHFQIDLAQSADEAQEAIRDLEKRGDTLALVLCDHLMPGVRGVDLLIALHHNESTRAAKKVLLTGQASHQDTISAINSAGLDHYIAKPWSASDLCTVTQKLLTDFVLAHDRDPARFSEVLDSARIFTHIYEKGLYP
jgi:CheY-like chemotaxis protein